MLINAKGWFRQTASHKLDNKSCLSKKILGFAEAPGSFSYKKCASAT